MAWRFTESALLLGTKGLPESHTAPPVDCRKPSGGAAGRRAESALLFGRGLKAGVDRREQKKAAAGHEAELLRKVREAQGVRETQADRQRDRNRQAFAEGYERANMKARPPFCQRIPFTLFV